ncbi:MAG TPA: PEP-CTERM sorting domain-containing protein [Thiobacillaceae bacterium]|nr:PEP-CTERM sorting domain-containing protein [Thiobacillaceae bacterium]
MDELLNRQYPGRRASALAVLGMLSSLAAFPAAATAFSFSTGNTDGLMAMASRPGGGGLSEIETADDFVLTQGTQLTGASFTGLLTGGASVSDITSVTVEIYRIFPKDSDVNRTSGSPTFSTSQVPTRVNSPSDVAFASRDSTGGLSFTTNELNPSFTASNSIQPGGIHPKPGQTTGGDGSVTGVEVQFDLNFLTSLDLPADHYFFVPQVELSNGEFLWLSAPRPIVPPGTPFPAGATDLQTWTRDQFLDPDWLRVGTDIVGPSQTAPAPTFNAAFSLNGTVPEPGTLALLGIGSLGLLGLNRRARRTQAIR